MLDCARQNTSLCVCVLLNLLVQQVRILTADYRIGFASSSLSISEDCAIDSNTKRVNNALNSCKKAILSLIWWKNRIKFEISRLIILE